ncbi:hypothetical protein WOSG25_012660 [Weissella oryzae SG25]|uniref:Type VII secretion system accessory factor EsaA n=1 Tax=Weissella oryzae (strain DSM 25784 / JCM 18191 / LMG 30913 / SG25) TaxID=1329250 RepID=A0A069CRY1_WEIOS|nr:type VII secretion protein EsaA [Weissella oryzae]GAK30169.1 hypothetical protein WOSG25_012660 [Weissella oryzae SG25]
MSGVRKKLKTASIIFMGLALACGLGWVAFGNQAVHRVNTQKTGSMNYILVNEDTGGSFNNKKYNLGQELLNLIGKDSNNTWTSATLDVANAGLKNGSYDAEIVIPQDFTTHLLDLKSINPTRAEINYQVRDGKNALATSAIKQQVGGILNTFDKKIVEMYLTSIVDNLSEAQRNVSGIVTGQSTQTQKLTNNVAKPLNGLPDTFSAVTSYADGLEQQNNAWGDQQNQFSKGTQELLTQNSDSISDNALTLQDYVKLQEKISQLNQKTGQAVVTSQSDDDTKVYQQYYDNLDKRLLREFLLLDAKDGKTGILPDLSKTGKDFSDNQSARIKELRHELTFLIRQRGDVQKLREQIATKFFGDSSLANATKVLSANDLSDEKVKKALQDWIVGGDDNKQTNLPEKTFINIADSLSTLNADDLGLMVKKLASNHLITESQADQYAAELKVIRQYASDNGVTLPTSNTSAFKYRTDDIEDATVKPTEEKTSSFGTKIDLGKTTTLTLANTGSGTVTLEKTGNLKQELSNQLGGLDAVDIAFSDKQIKITPKMVPDKDGKQHPSSTETKTLDAVPLDFEWQLGSDTPSGYFDTNVKLLKSVDGKEAGNVLGDKGEGQEFAVFFDITKSARAIKADLPQLLGQLNVLDTNAANIALLYSKPDKVDVITLAKTLTKGKTLDQVAASDSVYKLYNKLTTTQRTDMITGAMLKSFKENGLVVFNSSTEQYNALGEVIGGDNGDSLSKTLSLMTNPQTFTKQADKVWSWYGTAMTEIDTQYKTWQKNPSKTVKYDQYHEGTANENTIYYDNDQGKSLGEQFQTLAKSSKESANTTKESAAEIKPLTEEFKSLTATTKDVKSSVSNVLNDMNGLSSTMTKTVTNNQTYSNNFGKVLANTHNGGANNMHVFGFLANPLTSVGKTGAYQQTTLVPYLLTVISAVIMIVTAYLLVKSEQLRKLTDIDRMRVLTRSWYNTPIALKTIVTAFGLGILLALILKMTFRLVSPVLMLTFGLVIAMGILLTTVIWRLLGKIGAMIVGALIAFYLMLTPVLGLTVSTGTWFIWLYRLSPFQNIENLFTVVYGGGTVGWQAILVFLIIILGALIANFFVKPKATYSLEELDGE